MTSVRPASQVRSVPGLRPVSAWGRLVRLLYRAALPLSDALGVVVAFIAAYELRAATGRAGELSPLPQYFPTLALLVVSLIFTFGLSRLYVERRATSHIDLLGALFVAVTIGNVIAMAITALSLNALDVPRLLLVFAWALTIGLVWAGRMLLAEVLRAARLAGVESERLIIVGAGEDGHLILHKVLGAPELGYQVVGFVDDEPHPEADRPVLGPLSAVSDLLQRHRVREVVVAHPGLTHLQLLNLVAACSSAQASLKIFPDVFQLVAREVTVSEFGGLPMLQVRDVNLHGWNLLVKRAADVAVSGAMLIILAPVLIAVALAIKLTSPGGPVFFIQERVGMDGRPFPLVKFRSMRVDAEVESGPVWALPEDDRTTWFGRLIRRYSIDELPQLVNVLVGDMSLVGPRPERPYFVEQFSRLIPRYAERHQEKAGMTGWAQVNGLRGQTPIGERTRYDLFYVEHWSPAFDLKILLKTLPAIIRGRNAY
ncbi:MAG: undecaprenyl-phosphate glucose phosphotransferase [Chloroflexi bacterium]|nr:undecaprenyl-phosphate glucose phosphotransferase [Chloroflexota bacterium]